MPIDSDRMTSTEYQQFVDSLGLIERAEQEYHGVMRAVRRIEALLVDEVSRRERLEQALESLKRDVASLQAGVEGIEARLRR